MYNNIKNFINPRYATLFLFCIVSLLIIIFMKSRRSVEMFVGGDLKKINRMSNDIGDLEKDMTRKLNKSEFDNKIADINTEVGKKLNKGEFEKTVTTINNQVNSKLNTSDFNTRVTDINTEVGKKLNTSDFENTIGNINNKFNNKLDSSKFETTLTNINGRFDSKLNTADFGKTLSADQTIVQLKADLSNVPTLDNIGTVVSDQVQTKVGDINQAKSDLTNAYNRYDVSMASQYSNYNNNATAKLTAFDDNATAKFTAFDGNASTKTTTFDGNASTKTGILDSKYDSKIGELTALKSAAETAKIAALSAKTDAETAKFQTQKMYDEVFKEQSSQVVTQSNVYRAGLKFNPIKNFYEPFGTMYEAFETREGFSDDVFNLERQVIADLNAFNIAYDKWITCKLQGTSCSSLATLEGDLSAASSKLAGSINTLTTAYPKTANVDGTQTDKTQEMIDRARAIDALRRDLDTKMNAIIKSKNRLDEPAIEYDSTVYAGILWSVLGTSVLYYVFTEL